MPAINIERAQKELRKREDLLQIKAQDVQLILFFMEFLDNLNKLDIQGISQATKLCGRTNL